MSNETYSSSNRIFKELFDEIGKVIVGQHEAVEQIIHKLSHGSHQIDEEEIYSLMEGFI